MTSKTMGLHIRDLRKANGLSMAQVADAVGVSTSYISQVERGLVNPSIKTIEKIAGYLGVSLGELFMDDRADKTPAAAPTTRKIRQLNIIKAEKRPHIMLEGLSVESLIPVPSVGLPFFAYITGSNTADNSEYVHTDIQYSHEGYEFVYVLQGSLEWHVGDESCVLCEGDSVYYDATNEHWGKIRSEDKQFSLLVVQVTKQ